MERNFDEKASETSYDSIQENWKFIWWLEKDFWQKIEAGWGRDRKILVADVNWYFMHIQSL